MKTEIWSASISEGIITEIINEMYMLSNKRYLFQDQQQMGMNQGH